MPFVSCVSYREPAANMSAHVTDCACGIGAVSTRVPFGSSWCSKTAIGRHGIDGLMASGDQMRKAIFAQPEWLRAVPTDRRLPPGSVRYTGCGTSFHAAQTGGVAVEALDAVLEPPRANVLVLLSHEGETPLTLE